MPNNPFGIWSEAIDGRQDKTKQKEPLTPAEIHIIQRIIRGDTSAGIHLHKLKGTHPAVYSAYTNDTNRLLFIPRGSTLVLIGKTPHKYDTTHALQPGVAERIYQKPWDQIKDQPLAYEVIASIDDFIPTPDYEYQAPESFSSYHHKFITLDDTQQSSFCLKTPGVIIGDPGCGKSTLCSIMMEEDVNNPAFLDEGRCIAYFTESKGLPEKMQQAWMLDHPVTARQPEANQLLFINYADLLRRFGPPEIKGKDIVGKPTFQKHIRTRLANKNLIKQYSFIQSDAFKKLAHTLYHEFQIIVGCKNPSDYLNGNIKANLPLEWRPWAQNECAHYIDSLRKEKKTYDPNLFLWEPTHQPFSRVYHDEALSAAPVVNRMLQKLTKAGDVIYFADPNQQEKDAFSYLPLILNLISENNQAPSIMKLDVTYRLSPTIAHVANDLLKIKQNINQGKNEPHQSDAVICKPEEHAYPGSLEWVRLEQAETFVKTLNESNRVYVVITHPEYLEDARKLFGDRVYICSIEEARGQEFDDAVLFQVTNPKNQTDKNGHQRQQASVLQQINRLLAPMDAELKNKPNLPKAGKANHDFEAYINHIYIALSRVVKHGYFIEAGDPLNNELHKRLMLSIKKAMEPVSAPEPTRPMSLETILENAKQDLREGRVIQAKAGFLKAGQSAADFEAAQKAQAEQNTALMESMLKARNATPAPQPKQPIKKSAPQPSAPTKNQRKKTKNRKSPPTPTAPAISTSSLGGFIQELKARGFLEELKAPGMIDESPLALVENLSDDSNYEWYATEWKPNYTVLQHVFSSEKLRNAFLNFFFEVAETGNVVKFLSFIEKNDINQLVDISVQSTKEKEVITMPLICVLFQNVTGRFIIESCLEYAPHGLFNKITVESMTFNYPLLENRKNNQSSLLYYLADKQISLFSKLCKHSAMISFIHPAFFTVQDSNNSLSIIIRLSLPFMTNKPDQATCLLHIEAICNLLEAAKLPITTDKTEEKNNFLLPTKQEEQFIRVLRSTTPSYLNRYLKALSRNPEALDGVLKRNNLSPPKNDFELAKRGYRMHGLSPHEISFYTQLLKNEEIDKLPALMNNPAAPEILSQPLSKDQPRLFFFYLFESEALRPAFIKEINRLLLANERHPITTIFTKGALSSEIKVKGVKVPLLFELMQNNDGHKIIIALENIHANFYERLDTRLFYNNYYSHLYEHEVSLLFIASANRPASFSFMLLQNRFTLKNPNYTLFTSPYATKVDACHSILSNFLLLPSKNGITFSEFISHNDFAIYKNVPATHWLAKNHIIQPGRVHWPLFDLMLFDSCPAKILSPFIKMNKEVINLKFLSELIATENNNIPPMPRLYYIIFLKNDLIIDIIECLTLTEEDKKEASIKAFYQSLIACRVNESTLGSFSWNTISLLSRSPLGRTLFITLLKKLPMLAPMLAIQDFQRPNNPLNPSVNEHPDLNAVVSEYITNAGATNPEYLIDYLTSNQTLHEFFLTHREEKIHRPAEARLNAFIKQCQSDNFNAKPVKYIEADDPSGFNVIYLLTQPNLLQQLNTVLPNGCLPIEMAIKDLHFYSIFVYQIGNMIEWVDTHAMLVFFNEIKLNIRVNFQSREIPLLFCLLNFKKQESLITTLYTSKKSQFFYKKHDFNYWINPFYEFTPGEKESEVSHLDLLLINPNLTRIAILVIEHQLDNFTKKCFEPDYWFNNLFLIDYKTNRIMLFLENNNLHHLFIKILPKLSLTLDKLNEVLDKEFPNAENKPKSLRIHLQNSYSGRLILEEFNTLSKKTPSQIRPLVRQGLFSPDVSYVSEKDAVKIVKQYTLNPK